MKPDRNYLIRFGVGMVAFAVLLVIAVLVVPVLGDSPWRYLIMLLPVPALLWVAYAVYRFLIESDELQSKIALESLAIGFAGGSVITFSWGMLQVVGAPEVNWMFAFPVYAACWLIGSVVARRRYR